MPVCAAFVYGRVAQKRSGQELHRERGGLADGGSPASLDRSTAFQLFFIGVQTVRVLGLRLVRIEGLGAVRKVATQAPSLLPSV